MLSSDFANWPTRDPPREGVGTRLLGWRGLADVRNELIEISIGFGEEIQPPKLSLHGALKQLRNRKAASLADW